MQLLSLKRRLQESGYHTLPVFIGLYWLEESINRGMELANGDQNNIKTGLPFSQFSTIYRSLMHKWGETGNFIKTKDWMTLILDTR